MFEVDYAMSDLKIGTLAKQTGTSVPTIRYYEEIRLLRRAERQAGGQRVYKVEDVNRLTFIRRCRAFGFSIVQVRSLIAIMQGQTRSCMDARDLAQQHLTAVREKAQRAEGSGTQSGCLRGSVRFSVCRWTGA